MQETAQRTQVWPSVYRGAPWHGCWRLQGTEPEDGQEGVDRNTHRGGRPLLFTCIGDLAAAWVSQSHLLHLPDPSTLELEETFGII